MGTRLFGWITMDGNTSPPPPNKEVLGFKNAQNDLDLKNKIKESSKESGIPTMKDQLSKQTG